MTSTQLTIDEIRAFPGFANMTDGELKNASDTLYVLANALYILYAKEQAEAELLKPEP